jgi:hypothetical protein
MNSTEKLGLAILLAVVVMVFGGLVITTVYSKYIDREIAIMKNEAYLKCLDTMKDFKEQNKWLPSCFHG